MAMDVKYALKNLPVFSTVTEYKGMSGANYLSVTLPGLPGVRGWGRKKESSFLVLQSLPSWGSYHPSSYIFVDLANYVLQEVIRLFRIRETCENFQFLQLCNARTAKPPHRFFAWRLCIPL